MKVTSSSIKTVVMRRIAYSFVLSIITNRTFLPGIFFGCSTAVLRELVFVSRVLESFLSSEVGQIPQTVVHILKGADAPSLLALGVMLASVFLFWRFLSIRTPRQYQYHIAT